MPFDYQTLRNLTGQAVIDTQIPDADFANRSIPTADIGAATITAARFANNAVDLAASTVTGTMPIAKGGTGLTTVGAANTVLRVNPSGNAFEYATIGFSGMQVFGSSGTWNRPAGVRYIRVKCQGSGGGASGHGESGAAGGYSERILDVTGISSVSVTIDGGGGGTWYNNAGGNAGGTSFGPFLSASAGHGANRQNNHSGGVSGVGSGGDLNMHQGGGGSHHDNFGPGGSSYWGGPAPSGHPQGGNFAHNHQGHSSPGSGGTGGHYHGHRGSDGRPGFIVVEEYR